MQLKQFDTHSVVSCRYLFYLVRILMALFRKISSQYLNISPKTMFDDYYLHISMSFTHNQFAPGNEVMISLLILLIAEKNFIVSVLFMFYNNNPLNHASVFRKFNISELNLYTPGASAVLFNGREHSRDFSRYTPIHLSFKLTHT